MVAHVLRTAKMYAMLVSSILTAVVASLDAVPNWLAIVTVAVGAFATYQIPNYDTYEDYTDPDEVVEPDTLSGSH